MHWETKFSYNSRIKKLRCRRLSMEIKARFFKSAREASSVVVHVSTFYRLYLIYCRFFFFESKQAYAQNELFFHFLISNCTPNGLSAVCWDPQMRFTKFSFFRFNDASLGRKSLNKPFIHFKCLFESHNIKRGNIVINIYLILICSNTLTTK